MFEYLRDYSHILVTGPQRSGTTIITHMIAHDTKKVAIDEVAFGHREVRLIPGILEEEESCVLQAPQALPWIPILTHMNMAVVYVLRDLEDIEKSILRSRTPKRRTIKRPWFTAEQARDLWLKMKPLIDHPFEVEYKAIKDHSLYVPKGKRKQGWTHKSISTTDKTRKSRVDYSEKGN